MMTICSHKRIAEVFNLPKTHSLIIISVGGLSMFIILLSWILLSNPTDPTVWGYNFGVDHTGKAGSVFSLSQITDMFQRGDTSYQVNQIDVKAPSGKRERNVSDPDGIFKDYFLTGRDNQNATVTQNTTTTTGPEASNHSNNSIGITSGSCDLYKGKWFYDASGPLYTNDSCPIITQMQNCQGNGRPDKGYENWRWRPSECDLPRFNPQKFLQLMRGKTLAFIGDSVARNQMESMLCILWQVETPKNRGNRRMQRWFFRSTSVMIVRIWSSWLVHKTTEAFQFAPEGIDKLHLDIPDESFMEFLPTFDVVVLSSGHWFAKQSAYILNNQIVGGQLWWPDKTHNIKVNNIEAFGISVETVLSSIATHPNYSGLIIVRSYSPDHYEGGSWNTGGSCTGKIQPTSDEQLVENGFTNIMHEKQVSGFRKATIRINNRSKLRLMDITNAFSYRTDGHPGPYRSPDPNKKTKRGADGKPPPQDCLHWCMPGPVDSWNEFVFEIIRREFENT